MIILSSHNKLRDIQGASIVIALVFFLICAIVGSAVLTAASINTQATVTYKESRQDEYTMNSAASTLGVFFQEDVVIAWDWAGASAGIPAYDGAASRGDVAAFWAENGQAIWQARLASTSYTHGSPIAIKVNGLSELDTVYAKLSIDKDFNISINASLDEDMSALSAYNETVFLQCIPKFDNDGRIVELRWENPVISKMGKE